MDYLNEYAYYAQVAGLYYGVNHTDNGFQVTVIGYNRKLTILLETVIQKITNFDVKPDRFSVIKELVTKGYQNMKFQQHQQAMYYCSLILQDQTWHWNEELEALSHLEADNLAKFYPLMLSRTIIECYVVGNIEPNEAESMIQHAENVFYNGSHPISQALFPSQQLTNRAIKLERGTNYFYTAECLNSSDGNYALVHYIQSAFHELRSVEQLSYIIREREWGYFIYFNFKFYYYFL